MLHQRIVQRSSDPTQDAADAKVVSDTLGGLYEITTRGRPPVYRKSVRCELFDESSARQLVNRLQIAPHQWVRLLLDLQQLPERMFYDEREFGPWIAQMLTGGSLEIFRIALPDRKLGIPGPKSLVYCFLPAPALPARSDAKLERITSPQQARDLLQTLDFSKASWPALFKGAGQEPPSARWSSEETSSKLATLLIEGTVLVYVVRTPGDARSLTAAISAAASAVGPGAYVSSGSGAGGSGAKAGGQGSGGGPAPAKAPLAKQAVPKPVDTGLGDAVNQLAEKSPSLQQDMQKLKADGWQIAYGASGAGSFANRVASPPTITIDSALQSQTKQATQTLAHEVGHALHPYQADVSSKAAFLKGTLGDEGAATLNNIKVQREILKNGGPDIGIAGNPANQAAYNKAFDQFVKDGNATAARDAIGNVFGTGEKTSTTLQSYADYYGGWYDKTYPPTK